MSMARTGEVQSAPQGSGRMAQNRRHVSAGLRRWLRLCARLRLVLGVSGETVALLDYDRLPIRLSVSSDIEYHTRLHSCRKEPEVIEWIETASPASG